MRDKFAVITGGSSGIGFELAKIFAENGFDILIAGHNAEHLQAAASKLRETGAHIEVFASDLSLDEGVISLFGFIKSLRRELDAVAINAGRGVGGRFVDQTDFKDELELMRLNVISSVQLAKLVLPAMVARGQGRVLFTGSISGTTPVPYEAVYGGSKAFINSFSKALNYELKDSGVTTTVLMPEATGTDFFHHAQMDETKVGSGHKQDPALVAKQGFEALMAGHESVFGGDMTAKLKGRVVNSMLPDKAKASMAAHRSKPGSAKE
ncbi:SDR family NAD(P)-dependent oxidoreductase [Edaphobacter sp. DSM 109919]|uniref:SDR family NAD(P)-dependent oxidoreductase n=1 Tax=Edaphobacter paludis TaxID=3035702 RepID=A0AAU7CVG8_9BACT